MSSGATANLEQDFVCGPDFQLPKVKAGVKCNINTALNMALSKIDVQIKSYGFRDIRHSTPILFLVSSGHAADGSFEADTRLRVKTYIQEKRLLYVPMAIGNANNDFLNSYSPIKISLDPIPVLEPTPENFRDAMPSLWDSNYFPVPPIPKCITIGI